MKNLKKFFVLFLCFSFVFGADTLTFAAKKKLRSASNKAGSKKGSSKRSGSSKSKRSGSAKSKRSGSARSKRFAGGGTTGTRTSGSVTSAGGNGPTLSKTTEECRSAYVDCLDTQIKAYLAKYSYLNEDAAVEALQETGDPIRCAYFDKEFAGDNSKKNINELYFSYNYFCDSVTTVTGESGQPVYECTANNTTNAFATKNSSAYYKETLRRLDANELVLLNFGETTLGQNINKKIAANEVITSVSSADLEQMFEELGVSEKELDNLDNKEGNKKGNEKTVEMFSISVVPPISAGSLNPKGLFQKAHNICMKLDRLDEKGIGLSSEDLASLKSYIQKLSQSNCRNDYESSDLKQNRYAKYYQNGEWKTCPNGYRYNADAETCEAKAGVTSEDGVAVTPQTYDTGFLSAKASCDSYQQSLISARTQLYAKFKDRMKNYINQNISQLIKKEVSNQSVLASAQGEMNRIVAEAEVDFSKVKAETTLQKAEAEAKVAEAAMKAAETKAKSVETTAAANAKIEEANAKVAKTAQTSLDKNFGGGETSTLSLGTGCYEFTLNGGGGGTRANKFASWGELGGHGGKLYLKVCVKSGTVTAKYNVGKGGGSDTSGTGTTIVFDDANGIIGSGAKAGFTYAALGGPAGTGGNGTKKNKSRKGGAGCTTDGSGTCTTGGAGNGGSQGSMLSSGGSGGDGSLVAKSV